MVELEKRFFDYNFWSFTKHRTWARCPRQYYFEYIAPYLKPPAPIDVNKIRVLKEYNSRFVLQGQLIHDIINNQITIHCDKEPMDPTGSYSYYSRRIAQNKMMAGEIFTEYRHGDRIDLEFFTLIEESGKICLHNFFENIWPEYKDRECLRHEEFDKFKIGDVDITVKVDFVSRKKDGTIVLTDWKTGADSDDYETELQMSTYVLWALQYYLKSLKEIESELIFLKNGEKKQYSISEQWLNEVREIIKSEFNEMNASYEYEDFPPIPFPRECLSCRYARVCPEARIIRK